MSYDRFGRAVPTPRNRPREVPGRAFTVAVCIVIVALLGLFAWLGMHEEQDPAPPQGAQRTMTPMGCAYTENGGRIDAYVVVDPDTQVQYVVTDHGGITPRLDRHGEPMGTQNNN